MLQYLCTDDDRATNISTPIPLSGSSRSTENMLQISNLATCDIVDYKPSLSTAAYLWLKCNTMHYMPCLCGADWVQVFSICLAFISLLLVGFVLICSSLMNFLGVLLMLHVWQSLVCKSLSW